MLKRYINIPRRRAWLGAAIGAAVGIGSTLFGASKQKKAQEQQYALQRNAQERNIGLQSAANLTQAYANSDEVDREFRNRFLLYGGRRKAKGGLEWTVDDTSALIGSLGSAGSNFVNSMIGQAAAVGFNPQAIRTFGKDLDDEQVVYDSAARNDFLNNYYRTANLRCGGKRMRR